MRRHLPLLVLAGVLVALAGATFATGWAGLWETPDQRGAWLLGHGQDDAASGAFLDPVWRGIALMRAKRFQEAADSFAQSDTPEAAYNRGNALVMLGQYPDAVAQYDKALAARPVWPDAIANRRLAQIRADRFANLQGEAADEAKAPTTEAYNANRKRNSAHQSDTAPDASMSNAAVRSLWLLRVEIKPGDFLRARFGYQLDHASPDAIP
jgi:Ca-activated chloride channel homolog